MEYIYDDRDGERAPLDITKVQFLPGLRNISEEAFKDCNNLTSVIIPMLVTAIENETFSGCTSMTELYLSSMLETIGSNSFARCISLPILRLPPTLHTIKNDAFGGCRSIRDIVALQENASSARTEPLAIRTIGRRAFVNCTSLTSTPHSSVLASIGNQAFYNCFSLTEVTLGPSITSAARDAFEGCYFLSVLKCTYRTDVILPWAVTHVTVDPSTTIIHDSAFAGCNRLQTIESCPGSVPVTRIDRSSFWGCEALSYLNWQLSSTATIDVGAFARCTRVTGPIQTQLNLSPHSRQDVYTYMGCYEGDKPPSDITNVTFHEGVEVIGERMFAMQQKLETVTFGSKTSIHICANAFIHCSSLVEVTFHDDTSRISIAKDAFFKCPNLTVVNMTNVMKWVLEGDYGKYTCLNNRKRLPLIECYQHSLQHNCAENSCPADRIFFTCRRYNSLRISWNWILQKEQVHYTHADQIVRCMKSFSILQPNDLCVLRHTFSLQPPAPMDIIDAILDYLQDHDFVLRQLPREVMHNIICYF